MAKNSRAGFRRQLHFRDQSGWSYVYLTGFDPDHEKLGFGRQLWDKRSATPTNRVTTSGTFCVVRKDDASFEDR